MTLLILPVDKNQKNIFCCMILLIKFMYSLLNSLSIILWMIIYTLEKTEAILQTTRT